VNRCESIREETENSEPNTDDEDDREERHIVTRSTKRHGKFTKADDFNDKSLGMH
jgi:hypothetical protein